MHAELALPGLFGAGAATRLPALELLLARGRRARMPRGGGFHAWVREAFDLGEGPLAAGALTILGCGGDAGDACWVRADPVHLQLMRDRMLVVPPQAFELPREEADAMCEALNRHFAGTLEIAAVQPRRWSARLREDGAIEAREPLEMAGAQVSIELATRWHALANEAQMVLHTHPANEAREARGAFAVNSLWLWGAGRAPKGARCAWRSVAADDPVVLGAARLAGARAHALPRTGAEWLERLPQEGRHLAVPEALRAPVALGDADGLRAALESLERDWFAPLLAALRAKRLGMLTVHAPEGEQAMRCETIRADLRRFWRLAKPVARYA
jgi:hypothetical protein